MQLVCQALCPILQATETGVALHAFSGPLQVHTHMPFTPSQWHSSRIDIGLY